MKRPKDTTDQYSKHSSSTLEIKVDVRRILEAVGWSFGSFRRYLTIFPSSYLLSYYQKMCEEEKDKVTKNQSFLCAVFGGLSLPNTHIFPDNKRYEEVDGVRKEKERLTTDHLIVNLYSFSLFVHITSTSSLLSSLHR